MAHAHAPANQVPPNQAPPNGQAGFTLIEVMVALSIISLVVLGFMGLRTTALSDAAGARNWRLAREIAEQTLHELQAGARELPPESGVEMTMEKYKDFTYTIVIGEEDISEFESSLADSSPQDEPDAGGTNSDRLAWRREREDARMARRKGVSIRDYRDQRFEDEQDRERENRVPSETEFEDVMVLVRFPAMDLEAENPEAHYKVRAKVSTMAIEGMTPEEAADIARARGEDPDAGGGSATGGGPGAAGGDPTGGE